MEHVEKVTGTVEEFIDKCLELNYKYVDILEYLTSNHKG